MRLRVFAVALAVGVSLAGSNAFAASITFTTDFQGVQVRYLFSQEPPGDFFSPTGIGGNVVVGSGFGDPFTALNSSFETYCVDILGDIFVPSLPVVQVNDTVTDPTVGNMSGWQDLSGHVNSTAGALAAYLYNKNWQAIATADDSLQRTALQMAIWEVLYDTDLNITTGAFRLFDTSGFQDNYNAPIIAAATLFLQPLVDNPLVAAGSDAAYLQVPGTQRLIAPLQASPVPEPGTLALLSTGLAAAGFYKRRRGAGAERIPTA